MSTFVSLARWGAVTALCLPLCAWSEPFKVLDQPARPSRLAAVTPVTAVTLAGDRFVAVGPRGHVLLAGVADGRWSQVAVPTSADLTSVHFVSPKEGWAVGHGAVVLHTQDGGATWTRQLDGRQIGQWALDHYQKALAAGDASMQPFADDAQRLVEEGPGRALLAVWFKDSQTGYIAGAFNLIFKTEDGGQSWQPWMHRTDNPRGLHLTTLVGDAHEVYIVGEQGLILRLDEKQQKFVAVASPYKGTYFGAVMPEPGSLLVFGMRGQAYLTRNAGQQWTQIETGDASALTGGSVLTPGQVVVVSQAGSVLRYRLGKTQMEKLPIAPPMPYAAVATAADGAMALAGLGGVRAIPATQSNSSKGSAK